MMINPNRRDIKRHLELLTQPWADDYMFREQIGGAV